MAAPARVVGHHAGGDDRPQRRRVRRGVPVRRGLARGRPGARRRPRAPVRDAAAGRHAQRAAERGGAARAAPGWGRASPLSTPPSSASPRDPSALIDELEATARRPRRRQRRASTSTSPPTPSMLEPILDEFGAFCRQTAFRPPTIPYVSNLTGTWITAADVTDPDYWVRHLRNDGALPRRHRHDPRRLQPRAARGRARAHAHLAGPHGAASAGRGDADDAAPEGVGLRRRDRARRARPGVGGRCRRFDPTALLGDEQRRRVPLPTYPFEHQRYWVEPDVAGAPTGRAARGCCASGRRSTSGSRRRRGAGRVAEAASPTGPRTEPGGDHRRRPPARRGARPPGSRRAGASCRSGSASASSGGRTAASRSTRLAPTTGPRSSTRSASEDALPAHDRPRHRASAVRRDGAVGARPDDELRRLPRDRRARPRQRAVPRPCAVRAVRAGAAGAGHERRPRARLDRPAAPGAGAAARRGAGSSRASSATSPRSPSTSTRPKPLPRPLRNLVDAIVRELDAEWPTDVVVLRRGERWIATSRAGRPAADARLPVAAGRRPPDHRWFRRHRPVDRRAHRQELRFRPTLVLVGRTRAAPGVDVGPAALEALDDRPVTRRRIEAVVQLRTYGAGVVVVAGRRHRRGRDGRRRRRRAQAPRPHHTASSMPPASSTTPSSRCARRWPRRPSSTSRPGAPLVLGRVLADDPPDLFVLFSSVSSIIGLPGQVDYTAANAFLDAYAGKANRDGGTRAVTVNWNAWQAGRHGRRRGPGRARPGPGWSARTVRAPRPSCSTPSTPTTRSCTFSTGFSRKRHWLLAEHVVRGGESLDPRHRLPRAGSRRGRPAATRPGRSSSPTCSSSRRSWSATARCGR